MMRSFVFCLTLALLVSPSTQVLVGEERAAAESFEYDYFVSPDGNDGWSGKRAEPNTARTDGPFASLERACDAVRQLRAADPDKHILVGLRGGKHRLTKTLTFSMEDSAGERGTTVFAACSDETPIVTSGVPILDWKKVSDSPPHAAAAAKSQLWSADVPESLVEVRALFDGLTRLPRAQGQGFTPPHGWKDDGAGHGPNNIFYFPEGFIERYADFAGADLHVMPTANYEMNILPIDFVDREHRFGVTRLRASRAMGPMQFHRETMWIENRLEDLDEPGEWVFDAKTRKLYLWPRNDKPSGDIVAPLLTELVRLEGDIHYAAPEDKPLRNLALRGITFAHAERLPNKCDDGWGLQHCWEYFDNPTALLRLRGTENCSVESCRFVASGGTGVRMDLHARKNTIRDCEFAHLGGVGVLLAGYGPGTKDVNTQNSVINNWIHHIGESYLASPAIFAWQSSQNLIANNLIHNVPYTGIVVSGRIAWKRASTASASTVRWHELKFKKPFPWTWQEREPYLHGRLNRVERNDIHSVMERLGDGNAIYISGTGRGNLIKENFIHDVDSDHMVQAIRCDDDQEETIIEKNVIYKVRSMHQAIAIKGKNDVCNNFVINLLPSRLKIDPRWQFRAYVGLQVNPVTESNIQRNIFYNSDLTYTPYSAHRTYGQGEEPRLRDCEADYNLYYCPGNPNWAEDHFKVEREFGIEKHSIEADPRFVDVENGVLSLKPDSPAFALGIEPINMQSIGLLPDHPFKTNSQ